MKHTNQIILGVDPGTRITGYGIITTQSHSCQAVDFGCIMPPSTVALELRYLAIFQGIEALIEKHKPDVLVVETQYVHKNVQSAIKLGMARGAIVIAAAKNGVEVVSYAPTEAKSAVVGTGRASKQQVQSMVKALLGLKELPTPEDAADALALAICHWNTCKLKKLTYV
ncbi:MAG: crossover junction endodeoxyribonuclease RuvC [Parachlamydiales bacterium]|nr:crossover junction endodeoxyribonuclease RuvC [Parachlamydiales bacterium]